MEVNVDQYPDRIAEYLVGKTLFITGASGFVGKCLMEKVLRRASEIKNLYVLIRTKKGVNPQDRLKIIFENVLFDTLKKEAGTQVFDKVIAISGDVIEKDLGISKEDRAKIHNEVNVIMHCAATIRFDDPLRKTILINTRGTKYALELAKGCKQLAAFIHLSTAYCHLSQKILFEKPYPPPQNPHEIIRLCEWMPEESVERIKKNLLGKYPNGYSFSKALSEGLVSEQFENLPVIIIRPSIVLPIWKEPYPGWTDNINGPTGLLIGAGKGVIRSMYCKADGYGDMIPVDIVANGILLCAGDFILYGKRRVFNLTSTAEHQVTWNEIIEMGRSVINERIPLNGVAWYPGGSMKNSKWVHQICFVLFHLVPAVIVDALLIILRYPPVLWRVQKRVSKGFEVFEYYANNTWEFNNDESLASRYLVNPKEKLLYVCEGKDVNYYDYFTDCVHAARILLLKEFDDTIPAAKRHMKVMYCVDIAFKTVAYGAILYYIFKIMYGIFF